MTHHPIRVLFLIDSMRTGGAEKITAELLPRFDRTRIEPILCTVEMKGENIFADQLKDVTWFNLGASRLLDPFAFRRLIKFVRQEKIDIVHAQLQYATVFGGLLRQFYHAPMIITRHLIGDDEFNSREKMRNQLERWIIRRYGSMVVTVSDAAQIYYKNLVKLPSEKFMTIYNGIDLKRFQTNKDKQTLRQELGLPPDRSIITMVGVMRPGKGHSVLIEACRQIPDALFVLVGDGSERASLEQKASDLKDRVVFLGLRSDIPEILRASDIFTLPSDSEALPTVLIEAGAATLPSVATNVGGCPEVVLHQETGIIVPPRDPQALVNGLRELLDNPEKTKMMGLTAFQRVSEVFTLDAQVNALTKLYEKMVQ